MTDPALMLHQWLSPAFPVGAFAYSHGLEQAVADKIVTDAARLETWLEVLLQSGSAQADAVLLANAYGTDDPAIVDHHARALCASDERLREAELLGTAFCETVRAVWRIPCPDLTYAVAVGYAAGQRQLPLQTTLTLFLHAFASNLVNVAQRLLPIGQTKGQHILSRLARVIEETAEQAAETPLQHITASSFASDIAAMRHETLSPRIFRT